MARFRSAAVLLAVACVVPAPLGAQRGARLERAVEALRLHADTSGVAGLSAAISVDGAIVWAGGFGWADVERGVPMTDMTVSRFGSISKPIATVAVMRLVEQGRLDLDAPIASYVPDYPRPQAERITTRQLLSHTAGIRHYRGNEFLSDVHYDDVFAPLAVFAGDSLLFEPGTRYSYSTYGFTVVSAVTEAIDGRPWTELMRTDVLDMLDMATVQPEWTDTVIELLATFYNRSGDSLVVAPRVDNSNKWAGGGLVGDVRDLVRFGHGITANWLLSRASRDEMWTRQTPPDGESYGLGWRVGELAGHRAVSHSGGSMGATAMLIVLPDDGIVVGVLGNTGGVGHAGVAGRVARIMVGAEE